MRQDITFPSSRPRRTVGKAIWSIRTRRSSGSFGTRADTPRGPEHPVVLVSQADASAYCRWKWKEWTCRLPSEAEWEKASRGTDGRYFSWGNTWHPEYLNAGYRVGYTSPAGSYPQGQSPYGLMDTAGNIFEWTGTEFDGEKVVLKGCSWDDQGGICRAASRHGRVREARHILFGFRCVCQVNARDGGQ